MESSEFPLTPSRIQEEITIYNQSLINQHSKNLHSNARNYNGFESEDDEDDPELIELLRLIECPVCKEVPGGPPIYNCHNGHFVCDSCRLQLVSQTCVYCFAEFTQMRNYPLEALVTSQVVKCDYAKYGCTERRLSLTEYEDHVRNCWAQLWRPGKVKTISSKSNGKPDVDNLEDRDGFPCPKCQYGNSQRKIKCQRCDCILRVPTPMCLPFDYEFETCMSPGLELQML